MDHNVRRVSGHVRGALALRVITSGAILLLITGFMWFFHIAAYAYLAWALAGSLLIHLWTRPGVRGIAITILLGSLFAAVYTFTNSESVWRSFLAFFGLGSIAHLSLAAVWCDPAEREVCLETCLKASMFPLFLAVGGFAMVATTITHPKTYDLFLYAFDSQLGSSPSFFAGRLFARFAALRYVCFTAYASLPLAMTIAFALDGDKRRRNSSGIMTAFTVAAFGGFILYNMYPATGPIYVFGADFPLGHPLSPSPPFELIPGGPKPRNAMPSVHLTMALLILWNSRRWARHWRVMAVLLCAATILATLGLGEHYLVDLFVAVPFSLMAQGVAASDLTWHRPERAVAAAGGLTMVLFWLLYLRLPSPPLYRIGLFAWAILTATAALAVYLESRLDRAKVAASLRISLPEAEFSAENACPATV